MGTASSARGYRTQASQIRSRFADAAAISRRGRPRKRAARERRHCRVLSVLFVGLLLAGLIVEGAMLAHISSVNRSIRAVAGENQVLESRVESLYAEIRLETREDVIAHYAQSALGMIVPTGSRTLVVAKSGESNPQTANIP